MGGGRRKEEKKKSNHVVLENKASRLVLDSHRVLIFILLFVSDSALSWFKSFFFLTLRFYSTKKKIFRRQQKQNKNKTKLYLGD